jgi:hypothetical protein
MCVCRYVCKYVRLYVCVYAFLFIYRAGVKPSPLLLRPLTGLLYQPCMIMNDDCGAVSGINDWQRKPKHSVKTWPVQLCSPQTLHNLSRARTRVTVVGSRRPTASTTARPCMYVRSWTGFIRPLHCDLLRSFVLIMASSEEACGVVWWEEMKTLQNIKTRIHEVVTRRKGVRTGSYRPQSLLLLLLLFLGMKWNQVHSYWWMMMNSGQLVQWLAGETEVLGANLPQCRFAHCKSHMTWPELKLGSPRSEAGDYPPELRYSHWPQSYQS